MRVILEKKVHHPIFQQVGLTTVLVRINLSGEEDKVWVYTLEALRNLTVILFDDNEEAIRLIAQAATISGLAENMDAMKRKFEQYQLPNNLDMKQLCFKRCLHHLPNDFHGHIMVVRRDGYHSPLLDMDSMFTLIEQLNSAMKELPEIISPDVAISLIQQALKAGAPVIPSHPSTSMLLTAFKIMEATTDKSQ